jgi:cyclase
MVRRVADAVFLPFTVGGGVRRLEDADELLRAGADKVAVNTAAVADPALLTRLAERFGSQAVVLAIDARAKPEAAESTCAAAALPPAGTRWWARREPGGARARSSSPAWTGRDRGFDLRLTRAVATPLASVVASGGCGTVSHMAEVLTTGGASAALAASIFHFGEVRLPQARAELRAAGVEVRP